MIWPGTVKSLAARYLPRVTKAGTRVGPVRIQIDPSPQWNIIIIYISGIAPGMTGIYALCVTPMIQINVG